MKKNPKIIYIFPTQKNFDLLFNAIQKTLSNKNPKILKSSAKTIDNTTFQLIQEYKSGAKRSSFYKFEAIDLDNEDNLKLYYESLIKWSNISALKTPLTDTAQGYRENLKEIEYEFRKTPDSILSAINSLVVYSWRPKENKIDILDMAIDILIRFAELHAFSNGNKRFSIIMMNNFLNMHSLYLYNTYNLEFRIKPQKQLEQVVLMGVTKKEHYFDEKNKDWIATGQILKNEQIKYKIRQLIEKDLYFYTN